MTHNGCTKDDRGTVTVEMSSLVPRTTLYRKFFSTLDQRSGLSVHCTTAKPISWMDKNIPLNCHLLQFLQNERMPNHTKSYPKYEDLRNI